MKEDTPGNHPDGFLPILDTNMAVIGGQIVHHHYSKPMSSLELTMKHSAMSTASKYSIIVQEGTRTLRNMDPTTTWEQKIPLKNKLMIQILWAGYNKKDREIVSRQILAKYTNDIYNSEVEGRKIYRTKADRQSDTKVTKATWFRKLGATTTLRVPATRNSELAKEIRHVLGQYPGPKGTMVKVQEQPGKPLLSGLTNNPFNTGNCPKGNCPLNGKSCDGTCSQESVIYSASCLICRENQLSQGIEEKDITESLYIGETSRTLRVRSQQHTNDFKKCLRLRPGPDSDLTSFIWDHKRENHFDLDMTSSDFQFDIVNRFKDLMTRQVEEAVRIQHSLAMEIHTDKKGKLRNIKSLNRKFKYFCPKKRNNF